MSTEITSAEITLGDLGDLEVMVADRHGEGLHRALWVGPVAVTIVASGEEWRARLRDLADQDEVMERDVWVARRQREMAAAEVEARAFGTGGPARPAAVDPVMPGWWAQRIGGM